MNFSHEIDEDVSLAMQPVAWNTVSEHEARSLGISLGMYHDTQHETRRASDFHKRTMKITISLLIVCFVAIFFDLTIVTLSVGVIAVMLTVLANGQLYLIASNSLVNSQKALLLHEVNLLKKKHPITFQNQVTEDEHDFDIDVDEE